MDRVKKNSRSAIWILFSWHLISVILFIIASTPVVVASINSLDAASVNNKDVDLNIDTIQDDKLSNNKSLQETNSTLPAVPCGIDIEKMCQYDVPCSNLRAECIQCDFNFSCIYGSVRKTVCSPVPGVNCTGNRKFERKYECRYCYQLPHWQTWCNQTTNCALNKPRSYYPAKPFFMGTCWAQSQFLCLGRRCFHKQLPCNWSEGYKWSTTLLLSIFLGGFGVDRFYLGLWKAGIGKLLSFGGLGVWTLVDLILIAVGYVGPWDGSLYI